MNYFIFVHTETDASCSPLILCFLKKKKNIYIIEIAKMASANSTDLHFSPIFFCALPTTLKFKHFFFFLIL